MARQLYERWLIEGAGATLAEFVAEERARVRQARAQRRLAAHYGPLLQQASQATLQQQMVGLQNAPLGMYRGIPAGALNALLGGIFR